MREDIPNRIVAVIYHIQSVINIVTCMVVTIDRVWNSNRIGHLQLIITVNSSTIAIFTLCFAMPCALENKQYCSAAFVDISRAFDEVWHTGLLYKLT
jgi:hypothetical protein